ncbi:MAG: helix-turn-helix transcriptional regulator [Lachnospiraceae bacterium]|nr:helix-turn-helix transcriptional regulator [Lachnospiraceae bacterium]HCI18406.1 XRE family transcriptional regulator [Lachnospiraceae bacterium]HCX41545.1 XRE family transcriptional regulator [Lachnospiraceae bacterium]
MTEVDQRKIFARNLNKYLEQYDKTQKEVADAIGVIPSTFNTWCLGIALPRMGKVQALADYFHINKSDLIEDKNDNNSYYLDNDAAAVAQFLYENPDYKVLFDATRKVKPEDIQLVKELLDRFSEK